MPSFTVKLAGGSVLSDTYNLFADTDIGFQAKFYSIKSIFNTLFGVKEGKKTYDQIKIAKKQI